MPKPWQAQPSRRSPPETPWKRFIGQCCPHGLEIAVVDGTLVRNRYDSDFVQGGHGLVYGFIPKGEIWIASETPEVELPFVAFHECFEAELMRKGMSYNKAHDRAKAREDIWRRELLT
jgi:hypothetical protein